MIRAPVSFRMMGVPVFSRDRVVRIAGESHFTQWAAALAAQGSDVNDPTTNEGPGPAASGALLWVYRGLLGLDGVVAAVIVYFFMLGLIDGSVSSFNARLWMTILAGVLIVVGGGVALHRARRTVLASLLLMVLAVPGGLYALFVPMLLITNPRWN